MCAAVYRYADCGTFKCVISNHINNIHRSGKWKNHRDQEIGMTTDPIKGLYNLKPFYRICGHSDLNCNLVKLSK